MKKRLLIPFCLSLVTLVSCSEVEKQGKIKGSTKNNPQETVQKSVSKIETNTKDPYGTFLTDAQKRPLYIFTADTKNTSNCYESCAEAWPPVLADGKVQAGKKVDASKIGTIERKNGDMQVTYNGWPLYYFVKDKGKEEVGGQDVHSFGGEWYLMSPEGNKIEKTKDTASH